MPTPTPRSQRNYPFGLQEESPEPDEFGVRRSVAGAAGSPTGPEEDSGDRVGELYVPRLLQTEADRYGVIGVAFALVSWLVLVAYLLVGSAVVGVELTYRMQERPLPSRLRSLSRRR